MLFNLMVLQAMLLFHATRALTFKSCRYTKRSLRRLQVIRGGELGKATTSSQNFLLSASAHHAFRETSTKNSLASASFRIPISYRWLAAATTRPISLSSTSTWFTAPFTRSFTKGAVWSWILPRPFALPWIQREEWPFYIRWRSSCPTLRSPANMSW